MRALKAKRVVAEARALRGGGGAKARAARRAREEKRKAEEEAYRFAWLPTQSALTTHWAARWDMPQLQHFFDVAVGARDAGDGVGRSAGAMPIAGLSHALKAARMSSWRFLTLLFPVEANPDVHAFGIPFGPSSGNAVQGGAAHVNMEKLKELGLKKLHIKKIRRAFEGANPPRKR